jgi:hypothetical protein
MRDREFRPVGRKGPDRKNQYVVLGLFALAGAAAIAGAVFLFNRDEGSAADPTATTVSIGLSTATAVVEIEGQASPTTMTSPTSQVAPTVTPSSTLPATPTEADPVTQESTPTEEPAEPTPGDEISTPLPEPEMGDFGELPSPLLPSGGPASALDLSYQLDMSLTDLPSTATVYQILWPSFSLSDAETAAANLGITGAVIEEAPGAFRAGDDFGALYVSPREVNYSAFVDNDGEVLPDQATAIQIGLEWLGTTALLGVAIGEGSVVAVEEETGVMVVEFRPAEPAPNLAPTPSAVVTIGRDGVVLNARLQWPQDYAVSDYGLAAPDQIWQAVNNETGYLEADLTNLTGEGSLSGTMTITGYSVAYTLAGSDYLSPVIRFEGIVRLDETSEEVPAAVSVPAIYHQAGSFG